MQDAWYGYVLKHYQSDIWDDSREQNVMFKSCTFLNLFS